MEVPTSQFWLSSCGNASNIEDSDLRHASYQNFTECFNKTILQWIPCVYMNITSPLYLLFLCQKNNVQSHSSVLLNLSKSVIICILAMISVADLYLTLQDLTESSLKPTLSLLSYILCILCIQFERIKSVRSAWVMFIFWLLSLCVQLVSVYSMVFTAKAYMPTLTFSKGIVLYSLIMTTIHLLAVLVELILSCVSDESCSQSHRKKERNGCPEEDAPFLSSISYWWFWPLIIKGCKKTLLTTDVWNLNIANQCTSILSVFTGKWMKEVKKSLEEQKCVQDDNEEWIEMDTLKDVINDVNFKASKKKQSHKPSLVKSLGQSFGSYYGVGSILQLIFDLMTFINPIILSLLIDFIDDKSRPNWFGFIYGGLMFVTSQFMSFLREQHEQRCLVTGMRVQAALIAAVYEKAFKLSNKARRRYSIGKIVNLVSVDAQKFIKLLNELNMLWSGPLQIAIAMYFLWKLLGPSTLGILAVMMVMLPLNAIIMRSLRNCRIKLMQYKDDRIKLTNEALSGIKILKLYAWEQSFIDRINEKRNQEILIMKKIAFLNSIVSFVWNCCPFVVCLGTFALFVLSSPENILDAKTAFVSLSLFNILRFPFFAFPWVVSLLVQVNVSVQRLSEFLTQEELGDNTVRQSSDLYDTALNITDASFSWDCNTFSLKDINLEIEKGLLVLIVGAVGAGKSSLISAILGEMKQSSGTLALNGSLAYVSQQSWIQNASLRNNVLFNHRIEPDLYWQTIKACALISDLDQLPAGDKTEIGEKGINLSGGQKQRVALARALYSKADIYLLDDPLSAVDVHVAKHIFENVIGPRGILADKTRLMVTHSLVHLPLADLIVVIGNGSITEIGTYNQLLNSSEFFSNNMGQYESSEFETLPRTAHSNSTGIIIPENYQSVALFNSNEQMSSYSDHSQLTSNNNGIVNSVEEDRLIQVESAETGTVRSGVIKAYLSAHGFTTSICILVVFIFVQISMIGQDIWLRNWSDQFTANSTHQNETIHQLQVYASFMFVQALLVMLSSVLLSLSSVKAASALHRTLMLRIFHAPMTFFDTTPIGRILNRFTKDIDTVDVLIHESVDEFLRRGGAVVGSVVVIAIGTPLFLSLLIPLAIVFIILQRVYMPTTRQLTRLESNSRSPIYSHFSETLFGLSTIRAFKQVNNFIDESHQRINDNNVFHYHNIISNLWLATQLEFIGNLVILFAVLFVVIARDSITPGTVGLSVTYAMTVTKSLYWFVKSTCDMEVQIISVERIKEYSEIPSEAAWNIEHEPVQDNWPESGKVQIDCYSVRYRKGLDLVLDGITCHILAGEKVGLVGRTGAGKSSLALGLFRITESNEGRIHIDGIDITEIGLHKLRSSLTIIPQDPLLFSGTLRYNLDPFDKYTDAEIWEALKCGYLCEFVKSLKNELDHEVSENGENFSIGQRQLICLCRALLRKTKIIVLDEATASIDIETDEIIQSMIRKRFSDCTIITIAHRISTVIDYTRILVLDEGRLMEYDSPENLLHNGESQFYKMARNAGLV